MKTLPIFILLFVSTLIWSQSNDFSLEFKLRFENQKVYCDVIPKEDYKLATLQFGIHHNSDQVAFKTLTSNVLKGDKFKFNQICPNNVRILYINENLNENLIVNKGDILMTLEYEELSPTNHFICIMPSKEYTCTTMVREVIYVENNSLKAYSIFSDACVEYKIKDGVIIVGNNPVDQNVNNVYFDPYSKQLKYKLSQISKFDFSALDIFDMHGNRVISMDDIDFEGSFALQHLNTGIYLYKIYSKGKSIEVGKFLVF